MHYDTDMIGNNLKRILEERDMKVKDLAVALGITTGTVYSYFKKEKASVPGLPVVLGMASVLGVTPNDLLVSYDSVDEYYETHEDAKYIKELEAEIDAKKSQSQKTIKDYHSSTLSTAISEAKKQGLSYGYYMALKRQGLRHEGK